MCPFRVSKSGRILKKGMASMLHLCLHVMMAVLCLPFLETAIIGREGSPGVPPVPIGTPVSLLFFSVSASVPCKKQVAQSDGII